MSNYWKCYLREICADHRLNVWHLSLLVAIMQVGIDQNQKKKIIVSRSRLMKISHIKTIPTYHKYFKELQKLGYTKYTPSYHPCAKSFVEIFY